MEKKIIDLLIESENLSSKFNVLFEDLLKTNIKPVIFIAASKNGKSSIYKMMKNIKESDELEPIENLFDW